MVASDGDDTTNFDVIEDHKENIQSLPGGRSAKKLAQLFSPTAALQPRATPTPLDKKNVHDCIRAEYESEIDNIAESDDPLDVFDRYVRWTLDAFPSAQATPESQLHVLLERATQAFVHAQQYKSDPRYLKLWLYYIQFFADSPRETYVFLSRHGIGEGLALYYEEYAAWLEGAGRWAQAEEVYRLGIEKQARPVQRLSRKFEEFEQRRAGLPEDVVREPSSPALPSLRPALATKMDPFGISSSSSTFASTSTSTSDAQAPRQTGQTGAAGGPSSKPKPKPKSKMSIFSDADAQPSAMSSMEAGSKGWDSIGSLADRKKENSMEPKPWAGETLRAGGKKPVGKMAVFRDASLAQIQNIVVVPSKHQVTVHPQTGKKEYIFVNLSVIYPTPEEPGTELSFEEIMAFQRGWLDQTWEEDIVEESKNVYDENGAIQGRPREPRTGKQKKKFMEMNETQIIKAKLDSPSGPKLRKRNATSEPTMTMHTRAATDDIYDIFNAPLQSAPFDGNESENGFYSDDNSTTDGESTGTTRQMESNEQGENEEGEEEEEEAEAEDEEEHEGAAAAGKSTPDCSRQDEEEEDDDEEEEEEEGDDHEFTDQPSTVSRSRTTFIPIPPEDYEPPTRPYRDPVEAANNRLPFMTPITERTECSNLDVDPELPAYKTPCRRDLGSTPLMPIMPILEQSDPDLEDLSSPLSSPLRDVLTEELSASMRPMTLGPRSSAIPFRAGPGSRWSPSKGFIVQDTQCSPVDNTIRQEILAKTRPALTSYPGYYDRSLERFEAGSEIRRFAKALSRASRNGGDRASFIPAPVAVEFPDCSSTYTVKSQLGAGAFAPVYLVERYRSQEEEEEEEEEEEDSEDEENEENSIVRRRGGFTIRRRSSPLEALKIETPPSSWEFYMMRLAHSRLGPHHRATSSVSFAHELHLYQDETLLFLPFHPHGTLLDVINLFRSEPSGVMDEQLAMFFGIELLRTVEALHSKGLLHGDLKPDNCSLRLDPLDSRPADTTPPNSLSAQWSPDGSGGWATRGIVLIDFGRGIDMQAFRPDVEFVADWKPSVQDCPEMREGRPWSWQIDYYGLAGVIHCLLFGKYIETVRVDVDVDVDQGGRGYKYRYRIRESLKRYWQTGIWADCFEILLNPTSFVEGGGEGGRLPLLGLMASLRGRMEAWLEANCERGLGLKALLGKVEAFARSRR